MIVRLARNIKVLLFNTSRANKTQQKPESKDQTPDALVEKKEKVDLMEDNFERIKMEGLADRSITGIDEFQRDILAQNKFDLMNPNIQPKIASLSTSMGLDIHENSMLAEVNLGKIKVKKQNEIFLSEVDPNNIPEYYDIVFDYQKEMTLVGKQTEKEQSDNHNHRQMKISTRKAFQEKTQKELTRETVGISFDPFVNPKLAWKNILAALIVSFLFTVPILETVVQLKQCLDSIKQIEEQRMSQVTKIKREALGKAILINPQMKLI